MLAAIKEIINPAVVLNIATGNKILTIKEDNSASKIKKLHIQNVPDNAFAFTLDHQPGKRNNRLFRQLSCYVDVRNDKGINKGCDLILLVPQIGGQWIVLIFDLKSDKPRKEDTEKQLLNSELYVRYLMTMVHYYYGINTDIISFKRAIITTDKNSVRKKATYRPNQKTLQDNTFNTEAVRVNDQKEAYVYLESLLI